MNQHLLPLERPEAPPEIQNEQLPPLFNIREVADQVWDQYQKTISGLNDASGLLIGIRQLDRMLGGLRPGLHMLASRPAMGKTSLMLQIVEHLIVEQRVPCLIFSGALTSFQIVQRMAFSRAGQSAIVVSNAAIVPNESEQLQLKKAASEIAESPLYIEDSFDFAIESLRSIAMRYKQERDIGFIAIDDLNLLRSKSMTNGASREREVVEIAAQLKSLGRQIGIPVILLAELSRRPENRRGKQLGVPRMTDLDYCNMIEGFSDTITLLYRAQYYAESEEERVALLGKAEVILCKNPGGHTGNLDLYFNPTLARFQEIDSGF